MISGVSTTTTSQTYSASSSTSKTDEATLRSQLAAKQAELEQAKTDEEKATLKSEISQLKSQIAEAASSAKQSQQSGASSTKAASDKQAPWAQAYQTADKAAAESKFSSAAMDVLMRMPKGGIESADEIYDKLDTNDDNNVTKQEFVAGRDERMSEEDAAKLFTTLDTESKGSITKDQFTSGMKPGGAGGPPMGPPPGDIEKPAA